MKNKTQKTTKLSIFTRISATLIFGGALVMGGAFPTLQNIKASAESCSSQDDCQRQIDKLDGQKNAAQKQLNGLQLTALTYQDAINQLQAQISQLQDSIDKNVAEQQALQKQIDQAQTELDQQREFLASSVKSMYVSDDLTTVEMLATSKSISQFVDGETYRAAIQAKIQSSVKKITKLQNELKNKKGKIDELLSSLKVQQNDFNSKRSKQAELLAYNQDQQNNYNQQVKNSKAKIEELKAQQRAAMAAAGGNNGLIYGSSSYPWPGISMNYNDYCVYSNGSTSTDLWGYCKRQCVSYVAWKLATDGRGNKFFSGLGNAIGWWNAGYSVSWTDVQAGDVIVWDIGGYGHVMYVESRSGNDVYISQMNVPYDSGDYTKKSYSISYLQNNGGFKTVRFH